MAINKMDLAMLAELNSQIKRLQDEMEPIKNRVKTEMISAGIDSISEGVNTFTLTESERNTCKNKKDFSLLLASKNLKHCIEIAYEPSYDRIKDEIKAGNFTQAEFDKYVKQSKVYTLRIK